MQKTEPRQRRQLRMLRLQNMQQCVGTDISEFGGIRQLADAKRVADEDNGAATGHSPR